MQHTNTKGETTGFTKGCKILREGNVFYFPVGEYSYPSLGFHLLTIAKEAVIKAKKVKNIYPVIEPAVVKYLPAIVERNKAGNTVLYKRWLSGIPIISLTFASLEEDTPIVAIVEFRIDAAGRVIAPSEKTMFSIPGQAQMVFFDMHDGTVEITNSQFWRNQFRSNPVSASHDLVKAEIDYRNRQQDYRSDHPYLFCRSIGIRPGWFLDMKANAQETPRIKPTNRFHTALSRRLMPPLPLQSLALILFDFAGHLANPNGWSYHYQQEVSLCIASFPLRCCWPLRY